VSQRESKKEVERYAGLSPAAVAYALAEWLSGLSLERYKKTGAATAFTSTDFARSELNHSVLVVCPDSKSADDLAADLSFFHSFAVRRFTSWEILPYEQLSPLVEVVAARISVLERLRSGLPTVVVTSPEALLQKVIRPALLAAGSTTLKVGSNYVREELISYLDLAGYRRATLTEELGQFSLRGAIIDLFPSEANHPIRLEFFGDALESIRLYDSETQRSINSVSEIRILPIKEHIQSSRLFDHLKNSDSSFRLTPQEQLQEVILRMRRSAEESLVPTRLLDVYEDVLRTGGDIPALEQLLPFMQFPLVSLFEYLPTNSKTVFIDELGFNRALEAAQAVVEERKEKSKENGFIIADDNPAFLTAKDVEENLGRIEGIAFDSLSLVNFDEPSEIFPSGPLKLEIVPNSDLLIALQRSRYTELPFKPLAEEIILRRSQGYEVVIVVSHPSKFRRISELLETYQIAAITEETSFSKWLGESQERIDQRKNKTLAPVTLLSGHLSSGIRVQREALLVISDHEIFPDISYRQPSKSAQKAKRILGSSSQIKDDDYVVHIDHGVAIYRGLRAITVEGKTSDFLQLEYAEGAKLFVPVENIARVQKYVGAEGIKPALSRLGGKSWSLTKEKVRKNVQELAGQLLNLYAERELIQGFSFGEPTNEDQLFADTFPFEETKDQEKAIEDVLLDMAQSRPMDRLVCGDVGYGKTEVALRASFKAVNSGKQVAMLVPTTILADQHLKTFQSRLSEFGFDVRAVSRFVPPAKNKESLKDLSEGKVDIIVGTHRLLQKDVYFKDLGLLIIDEEHRFGVQDKEKLKKLKKQLDVLTLTATPIPRTLHKLRQVFLQKPRQNQLRRLL